ncbi:MAG TPA: hypothetical protein VFX16_32955 [Pseudonocardiaceae bacterium]|nr:hypothetical protein [Pseudonocardiaceae bacterium]
MVRVTPGPPAGPDDLARATEIQELRAGELDAVRAQADKWRTGLGGLIGLATVIAAIRGVGGLSALGAGNKIATGVLLLLAIVASAVGSFVAMRAAYGFPTRRLAEASVDELAARRHATLRQACRDLRRAVVLAYVSLAMVVIAVGVTWFA